jgi:hypothetical protein
LITIDDEVMLPRKRLYFVPAHIGLHSKKR